MYIFHSQVSAQTEDFVQEEQLAEPMMVYKEDGESSDSSLLWKPSSSIG